MNQDFPISPSEAGTRLDTFLTQRLGVGRSQIKRLLSTGSVLLNHHPITEKSKGLFLRAGSVITITSFISPSDIQVLPNPNLPLTLLAQGPGWIAVDKPAGTPVHPLNPAETNTLLNAVVARYPQIQGVGEAGLRSGVVHRLDIDTSGVLLFATDVQRFSQLRDAFSSHTTKKVYRAIVADHMTGDSHETMDLLVTRHSPAKVGVVNPTQGYTPPGARTCTLHWRAIEDLVGGVTLLEIDLGTGFLHQIRVMLAHLGHPVLGDTLYGHPTPNIPRQMLHASYLRATPTIEAHSPDPQDFTRILNRFRS